MHMSSATLFVTNLVHVEAQLVLQPSGYQPAMAPRGVPPHGVRAAQRSLPKTR
jgi:hypothetical protein